MDQYIVRRALLTVLTLIPFSLIFFVLVRLLPGDAALLKSAGDVSAGSVDPATIAALRKQYGLDRPLFNQYVDWVASVSHGDFGRSFWTGDSGRGAILSFLGVGIPPPQPAWGSMLGGNVRTYFLSAPWMAIWPGIFLSITVISWNLLGDALRDMLDPRLRGV